MFAAYQNQSEDPVEPENTEFLANPSFEDNSQALVRVSSSESSDFSDDSSEEDRLKAIEYHTVKPQTSEIQKLFYSDKEPRMEYLKLQSLPARVIPLFRIFRRYNVLYRHKKKFRRYFKEKKSKKKPAKVFESDKQEDMRLYLSRNQNDVEKWLEYIDYMDVMSTLNNKSEKMKLETIEKAVHFNPTDRKLLDLYLNRIVNVHTSDKVIDIIKDLISKDQYNIFYWKHYLNNFTSAMSCTAETGLKEFDNALKIIRRSHDSDISTLQIFKMSCLFLRQSGLYEQFFSIIHLMLSMNVNQSSEFDKIFYTNETQNAYLMEYEELILSSNLPMNELWYRMETIRAICNFLPVKMSSDSSQMQDPQRYVFNEDICNLVFPLRNGKAYNFDLFIIVLKLLKVPLTYYDIRNELFATDDNEIDDGMTFLAVLLRVTFCSENFNKIFFGIIKDLNVSPNYLSFNVEYEPFLNCILKILESCSNSFSDKQNKLVLILWLRLQRLIVIIDQLKLKEENKGQDPAEYVKYKKQIKSKVKNILKNSKYQNDLSIYTEYALIEAALGDTESCDKILKMAISATLDSFQHDLQSELSFYQISLLYCERKLLANSKDDCIEQLKILACYSDDPCGYFDSKLQETRDDDSNEIEDFFFPTSNQFNLIKAKTYHQLVTGCKKSALNTLLLHINDVKDKSLLKEKLYELYIEIFHVKVNDELMNTKSYVNLMTKALADFPKNIFIMHTIASQFSLRWFDVRKLLLKSPTNESVFYLLVASKYREMQFVDENVKIYQHRIYNTIDGLMSRKVRGISSVLTWRLYLRAAFNYDFTKCKTILYQLLDSHPMIKQLFLDGAKYLPEEHSQLHDLIIEKGLRTHAIVDELDILRNNTIH